MLLPLLLLRAALQMEPKDCNGPIVLKNSSAAVEVVVTKKSTS